MDWLKEAKNSFENSTQLGDLEEYLPRHLDAIAAALIAQVERKPQFVRIAEVYLNTRAIFRVSHYEDEDGFVATVQTEGGAYYTFEGDEARAFLRWFEQHANVTRLEAK